MRVPMRRGYDIRQATGMMSALVRKARALRPVKQPPDPSPPGPDPARKPAWTSARSEPAWPRSSPPPPRSRPAASYRPDTTTHRASPPSLPPTCARLHGQGTPEPSLLGQQLARRLTRAAARPGPAWPRSGPMAARRRPPCTAARRQPPLLPPQMEGQASTPRRPLHRPLQRRPTMVLAAHGPRRP